MTKSITASQQKEPYSTVLEKYGMYSPLNRKWKQQCEEKQEGLLKEYSNYFVMGVGN